MSQSSCSNPNENGRLRNTTTQNSNTCQQGRGRPRSRQFRLMSTPGVLATGEDVPANPPTILNIVVPSHINSDASVISSRTNVASLNVVSKSSIAPETLNSHEFYDDSHFSGKKSWMEQQHPAGTSSIKKCQSKTVKTEKCSSKEESVDTRQSVKACQPCKSPQHNVNCLKQRLVKYRTETESCGDAAKINGQLNEIFVRRLVDIESVAKGDTDIKLVTYEEWVDMLMEINEVIIGNMADLESEVAERLESMKRRITSTCSQTSNIEQKYRHDICSLMKLLKNAYHYDNWDTQGLEFQTVNLNEILGSRKATCSDSEQTNTMRALFDDDEDSRNRCCINGPECELENVIFEPLDVRNGCGTEAKNETKNTACKASCNTITIMKPTCSRTTTRDESKICVQCGSESAFCNMPQINLEQQSSRSASTQVSAGLESCNQLSFLAEDHSYDSLSNAGQLEQQQLETLDAELNELFQVTKDFKSQNLEYHRKRLSDIFQKSEAEKAEAYRKLDFIRKQLINLEQSSCKPLTHFPNDSDSGFSSKCDSDQDGKILNVLRDRLRRLNDTIFDLKNCVQKLRIENNDLSTRLKTEKAFAQRNSDTLKDLADMLCAMSGKQFSYDDIYNTNSDPNPFCQAIIQMKDDFEEKERNLRNNLSAKCEQSGDCSHDEQRHKSWDRSHMLSTYDSYLSIVNELKNELAFLSRQVAMVQKEVSEHSEQDEDRSAKLESSLKALESQNDLLQRALEQASQDNHKHCSELSQSNENQRCQVQHLQCTILEKDQCIGKLNNNLNQLRCEQQQHQHQRANECCVQSKDKELREMCHKLEQANKKVESLKTELERNQKQERFLLCETRKLNEELNESKRKHSDLSTQMHRLNILLKSQEACRTDICKKYEELERNYEDQAKQLRAACAQMNCLQERLALMDKRQEEHNMERNLLRDEVLSLKEKEATWLNKQRCLTEQLIKTEKELYTAHDVMKEQQHIMQRSESSQKDCTIRLQEANNELKRQFNALCDDYKQLEKEYSNQCELRKQNEKVIESFRKWKEAQLKADDATRESFKQYEEHIKLLLEEKQKFLQQYRSLHGDYCLLQNELERIQMCTYSFNNSGLASNVSENSIPQRIELIRSTSLRVSQKSSSLKCDDNSLDASGSNPT